MRIKLLLLTLIFLGLNGCAATNTDFQRDADIVRLNHLEYYGKLIELYYERTGNYPFQGANLVPTYVYVANDRQLKFTSPGPKYSHEVIPFKSFVEELELVLEREIDEYYDPQYAPDFKPNFYVYMISEGTYFFAVHVHQPFPFSNKIAENYYKIELSNKANAQNGASDPIVLFSSPDFSAEKNRPIQVIEFFRAREEKYVHFTKLSE